MLTNILFGLLTTFLAISMPGRASHHNHIELIPPSNESVHFVNASHFVTCKSHKDTKVIWISPKGEVINQTEGRVYVDQMRADSLALFFKHISLADRGNWTCETTDKEARISFRLIVNQPISFMDTPIVQVGLEDKDATIRCEVKGDPEPVVSWSFNGLSIQTPSPKYIILADGLHIKSVTRNDSGEYTCRAFQVSPKISDVREQTIRLNVQHKPIAPVRKATADLQYGYLNGVVNLTCEAEAEPHPNFTWYRHGKKINLKTHTIYSDQHASMLQIMVNDSSVFGDYKCKASNKLGTLERIITLQEGTKPAPPGQVSLRGVNSDTFDIDVGAVRVSNIRHEMDINGYRFELIADQELQANGGKWDTAKILNFGFGDGATYLINNLASNTTYHIRVASRNPAGLSDWTETKQFTTHPKEPIMHSSQVSQHYRDGIQKYGIFSISVISLIISNGYFSTIFNNAKSIISSRWFL